MAVVRVLEKEHGITVAGTAACVAGHSLGEYSALAAASTFSIADTARLLKVRGKAMQAATPVGTGAMAALLGLDFPAAAAAAAEGAQGDVCQAANDNSDGQVVISGHKAAVERGCRDCQGQGRQARSDAAGLRTLPLCADAACCGCHGRGAVQVAMHAPSVPVIANVKAGPLTDPAAIRESLVAQVTGTVRWRECVAHMAAEGVTLFVELGSGKVLTGLAKKNAPNAQAIAIGAPDDFAAALPLLKG